MADFPTEGSPPFINRKLSVAEWKSYVAGYDFGRLAPSRLVLHHTYRPDEPQWTGLNTMRGMQRFYAGKGWTSAPHIYTGPDGIWLATPMSRVGIHAGTGNGSVAQGWYSIGLEMVGYFDTKLPAGKVWEHAVAVMGELSRRLKIPPRQLISFHRDYTNQKSCPGWAVTKDWVSDQVEAYLNNVAAPPPPAPGPIGTPTPSDEQLLEALLEQSFGRKAGGQGYNANWAFHQHAVEHSLGMAMSTSQNLSADGKTYNYQVFAKDTLYCEVPNWGDVRALSDLLGGSIPPAGLGRALLDATYQSGGATFRPDWAFHQYAVINRLGPPVGKSVEISVDAKRYAYQAFAVDTLYNLVPNWGDVRKLSDLSAAADAPTMKVREALLAETYRQAGSTYHADWAFHQLARGYKIGAPLSDSYQIKLEQTSYALQVYALDTLYNVVPKWSEVKRLRDLAASRGMPVLGGSLEEGEPEEEVVVTGDYLPPPDIDHKIVRYSPQATAYGERGGRKVEMVVLHGVAGREDEALARMAAIGARFATHYYVSTEGVIYQLVDEDKAAWHAGFGLASGTWYNLNRLSIGVALERPAGWPEADAGNTDSQIFALRSLLQRLDARYGLDPDALMLWSSFMGSDEGTLDGLPLGVLREALATPKITRLR
jgi:hypothetical protein